MSPPRCRVANGSVSPSEWLLTAGADAESALQQVCYMATLIVPPGALLSSLLGLLEA